MNTIPRIPPRWRPGETRRQLGQVTSDLADLQREVRGTRIALLRTFNMAGEQAPAELGIDDAPDAWPVATPARRFEVITGGAA